MLEASSVSFRYGDADIVSDVSIAVRERSIVGLLGPNGAGKTTLLRLLAGTLRPRRGRVTIDGRPLASLPRAALARRIAVVPQETTLTFDYTVLELAMMGRYAHLGRFSWEGPRDRALALDALAATGTRDMASRPFSTLSGGEKQRVIIASALAQLGGEPGPLALLLDEPTASLDPSYQLEVAAILDRLNRDRGIAIVVSTHDLGFAAGLCRELVLVRRGRAVAAGPTAEVLTPPNIRSLYGIEADVSRHQVSGRLTVVPIRRSGDRTTSRDGGASAAEAGAQPSRHAGEDGLTPQRRGRGRTADWPIGRRLALTYGTFGALAVAACLAAPLIGATDIDIARVFDASIPFADNVDAQIFFIARLPRAIAGAIVGATLAAAGVVFQALLRNPLATPFTLGVSAGAALGAVLALTLGAPIGLAGLPTIPVAAFAGSLGAVAIVYGLSTVRQRGFSTTVLLLAGVTLNAFFSALITFVQYLSDFTQTIRILRWTLGDLDVSSYEPIVAALPLTVAAFVAFAWLPRALNLLSLGVESAEARGLDALRAQRVAFFSGSLATGAAVSLAGPIGFVGIIVPQLVRLIVGADHRLVLPAAALFGAAFLVACDVAARTTFAPLELPIGIVTAVIGGPFFLWLLIRNAASA